jgi:hypothetical protein
MKYANLLLDTQDNALNELLENVRIDNNISKEEFIDFLKGDGQELFNLFDDLLTQFYADAINEKIIERVTKANRQNQDSIIKENQQLFTYFISYIDAVFTIYRNLISQINIDVVEFKDLTIISMYGVLCRTSDQIGIMLMNGYTDGALKLWRSFYEYAVITIFLCKCNSNELTQRFTDSSYKTSNKKAESYQKRHEDLKFPTLDEQLLSDLEKGKQTLDSRYERDFLKDDYSWANGFVSGNKINFRTLEEATDMARFRMFYIWASEVVHPNANSMSHFMNEENKIILEDIILQDIETKKFIDPMQITLSVFDHVNITFLEKYCKESQYLTTLLMLRKIYQKHQSAID